MAQQWYYAHNGQQHGPVAAADLKQAADAGQLYPMDLVWKEGLANWVPASSIKGLFSAAALAAAPPPPMGAAPVMQPAPHYAPSGPNPFVEAAKMHAERAWAWDVQTVPVGAGEKAQLTAAGIDDDTTQRYLGWRRSLMFLVVLPTFISAIFNTIVTADRGFSHLSGFGSLAEGMLLLSMYCLPVAALAAAALWAQPRRSHLVLLLGGAIGFLVPIVVALLPYEWKLKTDTAGRATGNVGAVLGAAFLGFYVQFIVLALVPGTLRGCLRIKSLLPESILPGWFLVAAAPVQVLLLVLAFLGAAATYGDILLLLSGALLVAAPCLYLTRAGLFTRPLPADGSRHAIGLIQWIYMGVAGMAAVLLVIFLLTKKTGLGETHFFGFDDKAALSAWRLPFYWIEYLGRSLFVTIVAADLVLRANLSAWRSLGYFAKTPEAASYDDRMSRLDNVLSRTSPPAMATAPAYPVP